MNDLRELYQEVILDHNNTPRNFHTLDGATHHAEGFNPLCGDKLTVHVQLENDRIKDIAFVGEGCAISIASASIMTETLKGKTLPEAQILFDNFHTLLTDEAAHPDVGAKLEVLAGVKNYPARVKCATLAWHTYHAAATGDGKPVCTEL